jgi:hypothetical protein
MFLGNTRGTIPEHTQFARREERSFLMTLLLMIANEGAEKSRGCKLSLAREPSSLRRRRFQSHRNSSVSQTDARIAFMRALKKLVDESVSRMQLC